MFSIVFTIILFLLSDKIFIAMGAGNSVDMAISYGRVIFLGSIFIFFTNVATAILRGEGDANRAMYAIMLGTVLNIILDPIFIYTLGLGVTGAAYATVLSLGITTSILIYWLFFRKDTYVVFKFRAFRFKKDIIVDIFRVGLPASVQQLSMSITMILINYIIVNLTISGDNGVAVYSTGWRVVMVAVLPLLGMATAVISVTGAAFGAKAYDKLKTAYMYALKFGLVIETIIAVIIFLLAPLITLIFTTGEGSNEIASDLEMFIKISCLFFPGAAMGIATSAMFQGIGKGTYSLIATLLRTIILTVSLSLIFINYFDPAITGIWWAIVVANIIGSVVAFSWGKLHIDKLFKLSAVNQ